MIMTLQAATLEQSRGSRVNTVEFWRLVFTILVCLYHFEMFFMSTGKLFPSGTSAVEFFFVIAGFFMAKSAARYYAEHPEPMTAKQAHAMAVDFVVKKLKAIMPVVVVTLVLGILVYPTFPSSFGDRIHNLMNAEWEFLLMVGTPFGYNNGMTPIVPMWFLTALLVIGYIYTFFLYKWHDFMLFAAPVLGILFYVYFTLNSSMTLDFYVKMGFLTAGMVKAIAEMSLGITAFLICNFLSKKNLGAGAKIVLSLVEVYAIYRYFALTLHQPIGMDNFRRIVYILIIVGLSFLNVSLISRVFNKKIWKRLGSLSLTMYLCHFHLINVYMGMIGRWKMNLGMKSFTSASAKEALGWLSNMGGYDNMFRPVGMSWKDAVLFILLVMVVSALINLYIAFIKRLVVKPARELAADIREKKALAAAADRY